MSLEASAATGEAAGRAEIGKQRDMPKFHVIAKKGGEVVFWTFDGRRELDAALNEADYEEIIKIFKGKEIAFKVKKGISLS